MINKSLLTLGTVINKLSEGVHVQGASAKTVTSWQPSSLEMPTRPALLATQRGPLQFPFLYANAFTGPASISAGKWLVLESEKQKLRV